MSSHSMTLVAMVILGLITFFYRYSFISNQGRRFAEKISPKFLRLLGPATFAAIIANNILGSQANTAEFEQKILVSALALVVAYFTKSVTATLIFGLSLLYILQNYIGWQ